MDASIMDLLLDPQNPRLPEELIGADQPVLFQHLIEHGVLEELIESMLDNGFFEHEALIALPPDANGKQVVVEGNRRLAALMLIQRHPVITEATAIVEASDEQRRALARVPIIEVADRQEVDRFLGYRHISGLKPWPAESKGRYLYSAVNASKTKGASEPFKDVAKQVGSNAQGVRNTYTAFSLLLFARTECGHGISYLATQRFGVWLRVMNSPDIRRYLEFDRPETGEKTARSYEEVLNSLSGVNCNKLGEVIADLVPQGNNISAIVADSRDITDYGRILANTRAREALRSTRDFAFARQIILGEKLADQVNTIRKRIDNIISELRNEPPETAKELASSVDSLLRSVRLLQGAATALVDK